jgi:hypothetical protein
MQHPSCRFMMYRLPFTYLRFMRHTSHVTRHKSHVARHKTHDRHGKYMPKLNRNHARAQIKRSPCPRNIRADPHTAGNQNVIAGASGNVPRFSNDLLPALAHFCSRRRRVVCVAANAGCTYGRGVGYGRTWPLESNGDATVAVLTCDNRC